MIYNATDNPNYNQRRIYNGPGRTLTTVYLSPELEHAKLWLPSDDPTSWRSLDLMSKDAFRERVRPSVDMSEQLARAAFVMVDLDSSRPEIFEPIESKGETILGRSGRLAALSSESVARQHAFFKLGDDEWLKLQVTEAGLYSPIGLEVVAPDYQGLVLQPDDPAERYAIHPPYLPEPEPRPVTDLSETDVEQRQPMGKVKLISMIGSAATAAAGIMIAKTKLRRR